MISRLKNPQMLSHFDASHTAITPQSLSCLMDKTQNATSDLSILTLNGVPIPKQSIKRILKHFHKLNKINCGNDDCHLRLRDNIIVKINVPTTEIDLSETKADSNVLKNLLMVHASPRLKKLKLGKSNANESVQVIKKLASKMPELSEIGISKDNDQSLIDELQQILPHVQVVLMN
jgi:Asp-tRNA(Asn)/Glu-tRNA(Gln) amidotransferase C subunit